MTTEDQKRQFAAALLRTGDGFKAAIEVVGDDPGFALQISNIWRNDPLVKAEQERLLSTQDAKQFLPTKEAQARDIWAMATNDLTSVEDRLKAHRLYAEVMGHIEKPAAQGGINILSQGVMIVRESGSNQEWQERAIAQQRALTSAPNSNTVN
jgi:hypothetical protein